MKAMPRGQIIYRITLLALFLLISAACQAEDSATPATPATQTTSATQATPATPTPAAAQDTPANPATPSVPAATPVAAAAVPTTPARPSISRGKESVVADTMSGNRLTGDVDMLGHVVLSLSEGIYTGDAARYNLLTRLGVIDDMKGSMAVPMSSGRYYFQAAQLVMGANNVRHLRYGTITTCNRDERPHYRLIAKDFYLYPDRHYHAYDLTLEVAGHPLFTLPELTGKLSEGQRSRPFIGFGQNSVDGNYVTLFHEFQFTKNTSLDVTTRTGTEGIIRGELSLNRQISIPGPLRGGQLSLIESSQEIIQNPLYNGNHPAQLLQNLSVSRNPAIQFNGYPIPWHGFTLNLGTGWGNYRERPSNVTADRTMFWGTLNTPTLRVGKQLFAYGRLAARDAIYNGGSYQATEETVGIRTQENAKYYVNLAYMHRTGGGYSPFIFDRVEIPEEIFTAVEMPIPFLTNGLWRVGAWNRIDVSNGTSRDYSLMAIYQEDCVEFGIIYDHATQSTLFNMVLTAMGSFHQGPVGIGFAQ